MEAVEQLSLDGGIPTVFAKDQAEYVALPGLVYPDGRICFEWTFTDEERAAIARGENLKHWIWKPPAQRCPACLAEIPLHLHPVKLEVAHERIT